MTNMPSPSATRKKEVRAQIRGPYFEPVNQQVSACLGFYVTTCWPSVCGGHFRSLLSPTLARKSKGRPSNNLDVCWINPEEVEVCVVCGLRLGSEIEIGLAHACHGDPCHNEPKARSWGPCSIPRSLRSTPFPGPLSKKEGSLNVPFQRREHGSHFRHDCQASVVLGACWLT